MSIHNIALVRATNIIPFDGIIRPISNSRYLCKDCHSLFANKMSDLLKKLGIIPPIDFSILSNEDLMKKKAKEDLSILEGYLPYTSGYNSMVLFSLNGLCPDDFEAGFGNNVFSDKKCAIIEPLEHHINEVVSLVPTDTAVKGDVHLSEDAIILIEQEAYTHLSNIEKEKLNHLNVHIVTFSTTLEEAISNTLRASNKYIPEKLSLSREKGGFIPSETSETLKQTIYEIAQSHHIPQVLFFNILANQNDELDKLYNVQNEMDNFLLVQQHYFITFLEEFLLFINAPVALETIFLI